MRRGTATVIAKANVPAAASQATTAEESSASGYTSGTTPNIPAAARIHFVI